MSSHRRAAQARPQPEPAPQPGRRPGLRRGRVGPCRVWAVLRAGCVTVLAVVAPVLLLVTAVSIWIRVDVMPAEAVDRHVRASLQRPAVRDELSQRIARSVTESDPRLVAAEPALRTAAEVLVGSRQFAHLVDLAVVQAGRAVATGDPRRATTLHDVETELITVLEAIEPAVARRMPRGWETQVIDVRPTSPFARALRAGAELGHAAGWLAAASGVAHAALLALARRRDRALLVACVGIAGTGVAGLVLRRVAAAQLQLGPDGTRRTAALRAAFDVATAGWQRFAMAAIAFGALGALGVVSLWCAPALRPLRTASLDRWHLVRRHRLGRGSAALGGVAAGGVLVTDAAGAGRVIAALAGAVVIVAGTRGLARTLPNAAGPSRSLRRPDAAVSSRPALRRLIRGGAATVAVVALGAVSSCTGAGSDDGARADAPPGPSACNGSAELCERPLDRVTFAGTHNSMASIDAGFLFAEQRSTIAAQLDTGIRALLVDTKYGLPTTTGVVWTDFRGGARSTLVAEVGEPAVAAMEHLRPSLVPTSSTAGVYLCHAYCELGATPAAAGFGAIRRFLETHPDQVLLLYIQDDTEAPDTLRALREAGLERYAHAHAPGTPWPTLGTLLRAGTPLVVLAEQHGGAVPWFHRAFELTQDTPYEAVHLDQFSCAVHRGEPGASLLLLNNWVTARRTAEDDARAVNDEAHLLGRARRCALRRGHPVNVIAVNFAEVGALRRVVDHLNDDMTERLRADRQARGDAGLDPLAGGSGAPPVADRVGDRLAARPGDAAELAPVVVPGSVASTSPGRSFRVAGPAPARHRTPSRRSPGRPRPAPPR